MKKYSIISALLLFIQPIIAQTIQNNVFASSSNSDTLGCNTITWSIGEISTFPAYEENNTRLYSGMQSYLAPILKEPTINSNSTSMCNGQEVELSLSTEVVNFDSIQWTVDGYTIIGAKSKIYKPTLTGSYQASVWQKNSTCKHQVANFILTNSNSIITPIINATGKPTNLLECTTQAKEYQWFVNGYQIAGQSTKDYTVRYNGVYQIMVTYDNGCKSFSSPFTVSSPDYLNISKENSVYDGNIIKFIDETIIKVYPNPTEDKLFISSYTSNRDVVIQLFDIHGTIIDERNVIVSNGYLKEELSLKDLPAAMYLVYIHSNNKVVIEKIIKLN